MHYLLRYMNSPTVTDYKGTCKAGFYNFIQYRLMLDVHLIPDASIADSPRKRRRSIMTLKNSRDHTCKKYIHTLILIHTHPLLSS